MALFSPSSNSFFAEEFLEDYNELPKDLVYVDNSVFVEYSLQAPPEGMVRGVNKSGLPCWVAHTQSYESIVSQARAWRDEELRRADVEIFKCQDSLSGDEWPWRNYRQALRDWPDHEKFPLEESKPFPPCK